MNIKIHNNKNFFYILCSNLINIYINIQCDIDTAIITYIFIIQNITIDL